MRMFFHLHECGSITLDEEGVAIGSVEEARERAVQQARAIMSAEVLAGKLCLSCHVNVEDDKGELIVRVPFRDAIQVSGIRGVGPLSVV